MVVLYTPKIDLPKTMGWIHEATSWYLSTSKIFTEANIVKTSLEDKDNLTSVILDYEMKPDTIYYAKARIICNKSIFESEVGIIKTNDFIKIAFDYPIPSMVMTPSVQLDFDHKNMPNSLFTVRTSKMSTTSNGKHEYTSYIIETLDGEPVFSELINKDDLTHKLMDDVILESGRSYILKVAHKSTSNDQSDFAQQVFTVPDVKEVQLVQDLDGVSNSTGVNLMVKPIANFESMEVTVHATGLSDSIQTYKHKVKGLTKVIPKEAFKYDTNIFLVGIKVTKTDGTTMSTKYFKLRTAI